MEVPARRECFSCAEMGRMAAIHSDCPSALVGISPYLSQIWAFSVQHVCTGLGKGETEQAHVVAVCLRTVDVGAGA